LPIGDEMKRAIAVRTNAETPAMREGLIPNAAAA